MGQVEPDNPKDVHYIQAGACLNLTHAPSLLCVCNQRSQGTSSVEGVGGECGDFLLSRLRDARSPSDVAQLMHLFEQCMLWCVLV